MQNGGKTIVDNTRYVLSVSGNKDNGYDNKEIILSRNEKRWEPQSQTPRGSVSVVSPLSSLWDSRIKVSFILIHPQMSVH